MPLISEHALETHLAALPGGRVLDIATGTGESLIWLLDHLAACTTGIGLDSNARALDIARQRHGERADARFRQADATHIPYPDASFDTVSIANSLHHMADLPALLAEMQRVLKPGGHYIISEMVSDGLNDAQQSHLLLHHWSAAIDRTQGIFHAETYTRQELLDIAAQLHPRHLEALDYAEPDGDPHAEEAITYLSQVMERQLERARSLPQNEALVHQGEAIRQRLLDVGFLSATQLIIIAQK